MATFLPAETYLLCERCGYILNGLPPGGNCPECGTPIEQSTTGRILPLWEQRDTGRSDFVRFVVTSRQIIFHPGRFFRTTTSRGDLAPAQQFARFHWFIAALLFASAAWIHWKIVFRFGIDPPRAKLLAPLFIGAFGAILFTTHLAARLTAWEAAYRGYRLPHPVVLRAMYYHAAHCFPVALLVFLTIGGYALRLIPCPILAYLAILGAQVVGFALYLFATYWIAMRNLMYANR
jgi:hypothetical protein